MRRQGFAGGLTAIAVPGRKIMVTMEMVFIALLSFLFSNAMR